jgi:hypothetical protein
MLEFVNKAMNVRAAHNVGIFYLVERHQFLRKESAPRSYCYQMCLNLSLVFFWDITRRRLVTNYQPVIGYSTPQSKFEYHNSIRLKCVAFSLMSN